MREKMKKCIIGMLTLVMAMVTTVPVSAGTKTIYVTVNGQTYTYTYTVPDDPPETGKPEKTEKKKPLTLTVKDFKVKNNKILLAPKKSAQLTVKYGGKTVTSKASYKSSKPKVTTVSKKGKITAKKTGTATVTAKYNGVSKSLKITVKKHDHTWKKHYATKMIWGLVYVCNCGATFKCGDDSEYKKFSDHNTAHILAGERDNYWFDDVERKAKVIDYYYCDCGAVKTLKEPKVVKYLD